MAEGNSDCKSQCNNTIELSDFFMDDDVPDELVSSDQNDVTAAKMDRNR